MLFEEGIITAAKIILNEKIKIYAETFNLKNGTIDEVKEFGELLHVTSVKISIQIGI